MNSFHLIKSEMASLRLSSSVTRCTDKQENNFKCIADWLSDRNDPLVAKNVYYGGKRRDKLNWMNQLLYYFLCQRDNLFRTFLEHSQSSVFLKRIFPSNFSH